MRRSEGLDGLRALAALSVLVFHVWLYRVDRPERLSDRGFADHVMFELNLGLVCFFVLSGYLLHRAFARAALSRGDRVDVRGYALRRAARILPAYYACIAGSLVLYALTGFTTISPSAGEVGLFALFAQNYSMDTLMQIDPVLWTLGVEAAFYVVLPFIGLAAIALGRGRPGRQALLLAALVALTIGWNALAIGEGWNDVARKALPAYLGHFALGMLAALWVERRRLARRAPLSPGATAGIAIAGACVVAGLATVHETTFQLWGARLALSSLPAAVGFALVIAAIAEGGGWSVRWLATGPLVFVGLISYGVYLWHLPLLLATRHIGLLPEPLLPRMLVVLGLSLAAAWVSWRALEQPILRWAHTRTPGGRLPSRAASQAARA